MRFFYVGSVRVAVEDEATNYFIRRCLRVIHNWELDGSKELSGVSLSSAHIGKCECRLCCSGSYFGEMGEHIIHTIHA